MKLHKHTLLAIGILLLFLAGMGFIQFSTPDMPDNDGFYHIKLAQIMRTEGLKPPFPWLPLSILNPQEYRDLLPYPDDNLCLPTQRMCARKLCQ
jgi:hypothetical protein